MFKLISDSIIKVLREFGLLGVLAYVGGMIFVITLLFVDDFNKQILFGLLSLLLFILSTSIAYLRMKLQRDRDVALINQVGSTTKLLADKVGGNCTNEQVVSITQTIWQTYKDLGILLGSFDEKPQKIIRKI